MQTEHGTTSSEAWGARRRDIGRPRLYEGPVQTAICNHIDRIHAVRSREECSCDEFDRGGRNVFREQFGDRAARRAGHSGFVRVGAAVS